VPHNYNKVHCLNRFLKIKQRITGHPNSYEQDFRVKGGEIRIFHVSATPIMADNGSFQGSFVMLTDITNQNMLKQELLKKNEELNASYEEIVATEEELRHLVEEKHQDEHEILEFRIITRNGEERCIGHACQSVFDIKCIHTSNQK